MPDLTETPSGVSVAPVEWDYLGTDFELAFCAGFASYSVMGDGAISPNLTWLVTRNGTAQVKKAQADLPDNDYDRIMTFLATIDKARSKLADIP